MWFDSADSTSLVLGPGATQVTTWQDKSGLGNNAVHWGANFATWTSPTAGVQFAGNTLLSLPDGAFPYADSGYSYFIVAKTSFNGYMFLSVAGNSLGADHGLFVRCQGDGTIDTFWWFDDVNTQNSYAANTPFLFETHYLGNLGTASNPTGANARWSLLNMGQTAPGTWLNPATQFSAATTAWVQANTNNFLGGGPGTWDTGSMTNFMNGAIFELVVFNSSVSATQQATVEGYLAWKWGTQSVLQPSHPYAAQGPCWH